MNNYQIQKDRKGFIMPFATEQDAVDWADSYFVDGYTVTDLGPVIEPTESEKLEARQSFGKELLNEYILDNDQIAKNRGYPFTIEETVQQATKFQLVLGILPLGSLLQTLAVIEATPTDTIFTQERKDKYIAKLNQFLSTQ